MVRKIASCKKGGMRLILAKIEFSKFYSIDSVFEKFCFGLIPISKTDIHVIPETNIHIITQTDIHLITEIAVYRDP